MRRAFSLLEMVIALAIIAALAVVAVPRLSAAQTGSRLEAAENRILSEYQSAAELARARGSGVTIHFSTANDRMTISEGTAAAPGAELRRVEFAAAPYECDLTAITSLTVPGSIDVDAFGIYSQSAKVSFRVGGVTRAITLSGPVKGVVAEPADEDDGSVLEINLLGLGIRL